MNEKQRKELAEILLSNVKRFSEIVTTAEEMVALAAVAQVLVELSKDYYSIRFASSTIFL